MGEAVLLLSAPSTKCWVENYISKLVFLHKPSRPRKRGNRKEKLLKRGTWSMLYNFKARDDIREKTQRRKLRAGKAIRFFEDIIEYRGKHWRPWIPNHISIEVEVWKEMFERTNFTW
jgi:hypothetical protein